MRPEIGEALERPRDLVWFAVTDLDEARKVAAGCASAVLYADRPGASSPRSAWLLERVPEEPEWWAIVQCSAERTGVGEAVFEAENLAHQAGKSPSPVLYPVGFSAPEGELEELDTFYATEHVALLFRNPGWLRTSVIALDSSGTTSLAWSRLVLHGLVTESVLTSAEVARAIDTPWRRKLAAKPWYRPSPVTFRLTQPGEAPSTC